MSFHQLKIQKEQHAIHHHSLHLHHGVVPITIVGEGGGVGGGMVITATDDD
jgi:hypothetical protein